MPHSLLRGSKSQCRPARWIAAAIRQRPLTSRVRHIHQLTAVIFCRLAPSLLHHSANAGLCSRTAEGSCSVAAWGCTGCHSVHGEARSTQKGSLCRGQHACARTSRRICTPTSTLHSLRLHPDPDAGRHHRVARNNPNRNQKKCSKSAPFCYETAKKLGKPVVNLELFLENKFSYPVQYFMISSPATRPARPAGALIAAALLGVTLVFSLRRRAPEPIQTILIEREGRRTAKRQWVPSLGFYVNENNAPRSPRRAHTSLASPETMAATKHGALEHASTHEGPDMSLSRSHSFTVEGRGTGGGGRGSGEEGRRGGRYLTEGEWDGEAGEEGHGGGHWGGSEAALTESEGAGESEVKEAIVEGRRIWHALGVDHLWHEVQKETGISS
jgi:hypothetical protein